MADFLALKHESRIFGHSSKSNPVCGFSMEEQVRLCAVRLFLEPDTGLDHCPRILLSCLRVRTSAHGLDDGGLERCGAAGQIRVAERFFLSHQLIN